MATHTSALALSIPAPQRVGLCATVWLGAALLAMPAAAGPSPYTVAFGGSGVDEVSASEVDGLGNQYLVGTTQSIDFPTTHPPIGNPQPEGANVFVMKLNPEGTEVLYSALLGGSWDDYANDLAVDADGFIYVVGSTTSADFPVTVGAHDTQCGSDGHCNWGYLDGFVLKLNPQTHQLAYSTFLGGNDRDVVWKVALDGFRRAYLVGATASPDFPVVDAFQPTLNPGAPFGIPWDAFVARLSANGSRIQAASYLGGAGEDAAYDAVLTPSGQLALVGETGSADFPFSATAFQKTYGGGARDGFVAVASASLQRLVASTYLGGSRSDVVVGIAVDVQGNLFAGGTTKSTDFPTAQALKDKLAGPSDAFLTGFAAAGQVSSLLFSTYYGGADEEVGTDVEVDSQQRPHLAGMTLSASLPGVPDDLSGWGGDTYVTRFAAGGQSVVGISLATDLDDLPADLELGGDDAPYVSGCLMPASGSEGTSPESTTSTAQPGDGFAARVSSPVSP